MKIKINQYESYLIELPTEINIAELSVIIERLYRLVKINKTELDVKQEDKPAKDYSKRKPNRTFHRITKELVIELAKVYYNFNRSRTERADELMKKYNYTIKAVQSGLWKWKTQFNIKPEDVGLKEFPAMYKK